METMHLLTDVCAYLHLIANSLFYILFSDINTIVSLDYTVTNAFNSDTWHLGIPLGQNEIIDTLHLWINDVLTSFVEFLGIGDMLVVEGLLYLSAIFLFVGIVVRLISSLTPD